MDPEIKKMLGEILDTVKGLERRVGNLESGGGIAARAAVSAEPAARKQVSIKEFIISKEPHNGVLMALTVAYYLEHYEGITPFTAADLENGFRSAREAVPPNINDKANNCVKKGFFMEAKEKKDSLKAWVVTSTGERLVQEGFG